jgi:hypothetical protein
MCVTLSLADEEKTSPEIDNQTTDSDHQSGAMVRNFILFSTGLEGRIGSSPSGTLRMLLSTTTMTQILI